MLAYSEKRYLPTHSNIVVLDCIKPQNGYIYIDLKAYNSGVILSQNEKYMDKNYLLETSKPTNINYRKSIEELFEELPYPLKPLSYLLYMTQKEYTNFNEQIAALNVILQNVYPTYWFQTPKDIRPNLSYSTLLLTEAEYDWTNFFNSCIDYDTIIHPEKADTKSFPIFVVNAVSTENSSLFSQQSSSESLNNSCIVDVDLDEDDTSLDTINLFENSNPIDTNEKNKTILENQYKKLLQIEEDNG